MPLRPPTTNLESCSDGGAFADGGLYRRSLARAAEKYPERWHGGVLGADGERRAAKRTVGFFALGPGSAVGIPRSGFSKGFGKAYGACRTMRPSRGGIACLSLSEGCGAAAPRRNSCAHRVRAPHSVSEVRVRGTRKSKADRKRTGYRHPGR